MANTYYDETSLRNLRTWEKSIKEAAELRSIYGLRMLRHKGGDVVIGYYDTCKECGERLYAPFGNYGRPLDEKFIHCTKSEEDGHGLWASVINLVLN